MISCAGNPAFRPFADLTDADYALGLRSKLMGQVTLARIAKDHLRDGGSITLTTGTPALSLPDVRVKERRSERARVSRLIRHRHP